GRERAELIAERDAERSAWERRLHAERATLAEDATRTRATLEEQVAAAIAARDTETARADALAAELRASAEQLSGARREHEVVLGELTMVRAEATRLRDDRERVLAATADPNAEPAAVIVALRDTVAAREADLAAATAERAELLRRIAAEAEAADQRLAAGLSAAAHE